MVDPKNQWCLQVDVTNVCPRECSNCTRLVGHTNEWHMEPELFAKCIEAAKEFPTSNAASHTPYKLVGIIGGEPLCHPEFEKLVEIMEAAVPYDNRGLWTGLGWRTTRYAALIERVFPAHGIHCNDHDTPSVHTPVLVAVDDVVFDAHERQSLINNCWLQERWASGFTPGGFFCCEVMGHLAAAFNEPKGLPIDPGCWQRPLSDFQGLIDKWCHKCGVPLMLKGRLAGECIDDISQSNLDGLQASPRIQAGKFERFDPSSSEATSVPWRYRR